MAPSMPAGMPDMSISGMPAMVPVDTSIQSWTLGGLVFCASAVPASAKHPSVSAAARKKSEAVIDEPFHAPEGATKQVIRPTARWAP